MIRYVRIRCRVQIQDVANLEFIWSMIDMREILKKKKTLRNWKRNVISDAIHLSFLFQVIKMFIEACERSESANGEI